MPKRLLNEIEIERYTKKYINDKYNRGYIRNDEKRQLFEDVINSRFLKRKGNENRITTFNRLWRKAQRITRKIYGNNKNIAERSKISADFIRENTFYKSSFLENFHVDKEVGIEESVRIAEVQTYFERISKFKDKYGKSKLSAGDIIGIQKEMTINDFLDLFSDGSIDKTQMNKIIKKFKKSSDYYKGTIGSD